MISTKKNNNSGFTIIELLVTIFIFSIVFTGILSALTFGFRLVSQSKNKAMANAIANQEVESIRNLSYDLVGIDGSFPSGSLEQTSQVSQNGTDFLVERNIAYVVDDADGVADPEDECPNDYKRISIKVSWQGRHSGEVNFSTDIMPETLAEECAVTGGVLSVSVFDATGTMISSPTIEIKNPATGSTVSVANPSSGQHYFSLPSGEYKIVVTKDGYSTEQTFASNESYNGQNIISPDAANPIVIDKRLISQSFSIDHLGSLNIAVTGSASLEYPPISGPRLAIHGNKRVGTDADGEAIYKYSQESIADGSGSITLSSMEWDLYTFTSQTGSLNITSIEFPYGQVINQPVGLSPSEVKQMRVILESQNSLLVIVKNATTSLPVFSAAVRIYNTDLTFDETLYTDEQGRAYLIPMDAGDFKIDISASGYNSSLDNPISVNGNTTETKNITQIE